MKKITLITSFLLGALSIFAKDDRPNIIFFLADDQTQFSTGVYGNKQVKTPNLDKLASDGVIFKNSYATTAICMASRATIMTGMYEYKTGCNFYKNPLSREKFKKSYPVLLREAGYYTGFAGKFGFDVADNIKEVHDAISSKFKQGAAVLPAEDFDWFYGVKEQTSYKTAENEGFGKYAKQYPHSTRSYGAACSDFVKEAVKTGKPFCLSMSFKAPHTPYKPDPIFDNAYKGIIWEKPANYGAANAKHLSKQARLSTAYIATRQAYLPKSYNGTKKAYHQLVHGIDVAVGMVLEELKTQGVADNTIIIYTSDNGYNLGSHGFGHKALAYEEASKVPLIIYDPRAKKTSTIWREALVGNIDFAPTILDFAGVAIPENMDGKSLLPVLDNPKAKGHDSLALMQHIECFPAISMAVVTPEFKYIYYPYENKIEAGQELYDLRNDRIEMHNHINDPEYASILADMKKIYQSQWQRYNDLNVKDFSYQQLANMFNQNMTWEEKVASIPEEMKDTFPNAVPVGLTYENILKKTKYKGDIYNFDAVIKYMEKTNK